MNVRTALGSLAVVALLAGGLTGCSEQISGTPGPAPTVGASGDFPTSTPTDDPTSDPTDDPSSDAPTDDPTDDPTDAPTDDPTDEPTDDPADTDPTDLCAGLQEIVDTDTGDGEAASRIYVSLTILTWGIVTDQSDAFAAADPEASTKCPDTRTAVLALTGTPDLASTQN